MKLFFLVALILVASAETAEECVRGNCPGEVTACELNVFCTAQAISCYNSCGQTFDNIQCLADCADKSTNQKMINLDSCAHQNCSKFLTTSCVNECVAMFEMECSGNKTKLSGIQCLNGFFQKNPRCQCLKDIE